MVTSNTYDYRFVQHQVEPMQATVLAWDWDAKWPNRVPVSF